MAANRAAFVQFPEEILTKVFSQLNMEDLLQATAVCKAWQQVASSEALWEIICRRRWRLWTKSSTSAAGPSQHYWRKMCQRRVEFDHSARRLVAEMAWPLERHKSLRELVTLGDLVVEELERLSSKQGDQEEGTRFFASKSLERINQNNCIIAMQELLATPLPQLEDQLAKGALIIAKLRYQDLDIDVIESKLEDWKDILLQRLERDADVARHGGLGTSAGTLAGLKQLNVLLFGETRVLPPGEDADSQGTRSDPLVDVDPQRQCMNLRANRDDYYNPSNYYLNDVLDLRKGAEISLAIIHSAVGRRCNIPVRIVAMPMHYITKVGAEGHPDERFVEVFHSGRLLQRRECIKVIQDMGLSIEPQRLAPVPPKRVFVAILDDLIAMYSQGDGDQDARRPPKEGQRMLLPLLNLLLAITPEDCSRRFARVKVLEEIYDFEAALEDLQTLVQLTDPIGLNAQFGIPNAMLQQSFQAAQDAQERHAAWCNERRLPKPRDVLYRVGNIVRHVRLQYPGVIFGWDKEFSYDEKEAARMKIDQLQYGRSQPFYRVLVDQNFWSAATLVAQENITLAPNAGPILHEDLGMHFLGYRDGKYIPNAYLSYIYSDDLLDATIEPQLPIAGDDRDGHGIDAATVVGAAPIVTASLAEPSSSVNSLPDPLRSLPLESDPSSSKPSQ